MKSFQILELNKCVGWNKFVGEKKILKFNKRDVPNKSVMEGKTSPELINVQHVY